MGPAGQPGRPGLHSRLVQCGPATRVCGGWACGVTDAESPCDDASLEVRGWLMGVSDDFRCDTEAEQDRLQYHLLLSQGPLTSRPETGERDCRRRTPPALPEPALAAEWLCALPAAEHAAVLPRGRRHARIELPRTSPVAAFAVIAANVVRYQVPDPHLQRPGDGAQLGRAISKLGAAQTTSVRTTPKSRPCRCRRDAAFLPSDTHSIENGRGTTPTAPRRRCARAGATSTFDGIPSVNARSHQVGGNLLRTADQNADHCW